MHTRAVSDFQNQPQTAAALGDDDLLRRLIESVGRSRRVEAEIIAHIAEVDARRLYTREACPSMFAYCTEVLHLSEPEAYLRIAAARASRSYPALLVMLGAGRIHLSGIALLAPHLTTANCEAVLARAARLSKRQIEELVAELAPKADPPSLIRRLPSSSMTRPIVSVLQPCPASVTQPPLRPAIVQPTAPGRFRVQFTASGELRAKLDRLVTLMRHKVPDGDLATILEDAITERLARLEARRFAKTRPRKELAAADTSASGSRYIPAPVRRAVDERDGHQCRYVAADGRRCRARARLEFHHEAPHARGGDRSPENIRLLCRAHNVAQAEHDFGRRVMARYRRPGASPP